MKKNLFLILSIATVFLISSVSAYSSDWVYIAKSENSEYYLSLDDISIDGQNLTFWDKKMYTISKDYIKLRIIINCTEGIYNILNLVDYKSDKAVEKIYNFEQSPKWVVISTDPVMEAFRAVLCENSKPAQNIKNRYRKFFIKELLKSISKEK